MQVSVVIPTYNSAAFVERALLSVVSQTEGLSHEILLVDDCSDDREALSRLVQRYEAVRLIEKPARSNAAVSRNRGLEESRGAFVFFLDSDDALAPGALKRRMAMHRDSGAGVIFGNYLARLADASRLSASRLPAYRGGDMRHYLFVERGDVRSSTLSLCKAFWQGTRFDDATRKHQDWVFAIRAFHQGERLLFDPQPTAVMDVTRQGRMSSSANLDASRYVVKRYLCQDHHRNAFSRRQWLSSLSRRDLTACRFQVEIFTPGNWRERRDLALFRLASHPVLIGAASALLTLALRLRRLGSRSGAMQR